MKIILLAAAATALLAGSAMAQSASDYQRAYMRKALAQPGGTTARVPTGIDVPGPTDYVLRGDGKVVAIDKESARRGHERTFWYYKDKEGAGASTGAP